MLLDVSEAFALVGVASESSSAPGHGHSVHCGCAPSEKEVALHFCRLGHLSNDWLHTFLLHGIGRARCTTARPARRNKLGWVLYRDSAIAGIAIAKLRCGDLLGFIERR